MARNTGTADNSAAPLASEAQVVAYLKANPEFLSRHPDLIARQAPPSRFGAGGPVVDLQQYMIHRLHDEMDQLRGCAEHLITTSRSNMSTQSRTHDAVLSILEAEGMGGLARVVAEDLPPLLDVDVVALGFETGAHPAILPGIRALPVGLLDQVMGVGEVMLRAQTHGDPVIFGDGAGLVSSFALVRLDPLNCPAGLLALGSRSDRTFQSSQGTELLAFMARVIEDCVQRWWPAA